MLGRRGVMASGAVLLGWPALAAEPELGFAALYASVGVRGVVLSERVRQLTGGMVAMTGYMAPPLQAESQFFVLTSEPLSLCPFCQSDADWPIDIVVIYLRQAGALPGGGARIRALGRLDVGSWADPETGFVSLVRLMEARLVVR